MSSVESSEVASTVSGLPDTQTEAVSTDAPAMTSQAGAETAAATTPSLSDALSTTALHTSIASSYSSRRILRKITSASTVVPTEGTSIGLPTSAAESIVSTDKASIIFMATDEEGRTAVEDTSVSPTSSPTSAIDLSTTTDKSTSIITAIEDRATVSAPVSSSFGSSSTASSAASFSSRRRRTSTPAYTMTSSSASTGSTVFLSSATSNIDAASTFTSFMRLPSEAMTTMKTVTAFGMETTMKEDTTIAKSSQETSISSMDLDTSSSISVIDNTTAGSSAAETFSRSSTVSATEDATVTGLAGHLLPILPATSTAPSQSLEASTLGHGTSTSYVTGVPTVASIGMTAVTSANLMTVPQTDHTESNGYEDAVSGISSTSSLSADRRRRTPGRPRVMTAVFVTQDAAMVDSPTTSGSADSSSSSMQSSAGEVPSSVISEPPAVFSKAASAMLSSSTSTGQEKPVTQSFASVEALQEMTISEWSGLSQASSSEVTTYSTTASTAGSPFFIRRTLRTATRTPAGLTVSSMPETATGAAEPTSFYDFDPLGGESEGPEAMQGATSTRRQKVLKRRTMSPTLGPIVLLSPDDQPLDYADYDSLSPVDSASTANSSYGTSVWPVNGGTASISSSPGVIVDRAKMTGNSLIAVTEQAELPNV